ncbi:hypothetical protein FC56_GL000219 [Lentilactobacillus senioris DSM 24302 = JCM 17472]|uniref:Uncharacterized protein n=1 Tax=Lentilactobacillus senioris DSM 24302 = JCM 17472 TaxID=1423802 RepID=A0A0R2D1Q8_9LACO|nr:hypothetical protein [Lentilactobacillus senioris]KRM93507.1 hypothetical protein FC56_GL000219 [Lentilactobacillus senioris DSM 24302 = JCM 17472]
MSLIAIIIDFITLGFYFLQLKVLTHSIFIVGIIIQAVAVLFLLSLVISYKGQRKSKFWNDGYHPYTFKYGIIVVSFVLNGIMLFLYVLNLTGNDIVFSGF